MEFLKEVLGDELFETLVEKVNAYNADEANKDKQIKIANLATGEYVGKGKYDNLQAMLDGSKGDVATLTKTIEELKQGNVDAETLQAKVAEAEKALAESKAREQQMQIKYALDLAMLSEGVKKDNAELLAIALERKLVEKGEKLELDENGNIKDLSDKLSGLKVQYPSMFESAKDADKKIVELDLPKRKEDDATQPMTLAEALKENYEKAKG